MTKRRPKGEILFPEFEDSLAAARDYVYATLSEGTYCPCCDQYAGEYLQKMDWNKRLILLTLQKLGATNEHFAKTPNINEFIRTYFGCKDHSNPTAAIGHLGRWGLVKPRAPGEHTGWWALTKKGEGFLDLMISVPQNAYLYNWEVHRWGDKEIKLNEIEKRKKK